MSTLSVCMVAYNEAANIARAIESIRDIAIEIIVLDRESTDETVAIAVALGATVRHSANDHLPDAAKNTVFSMASGDWIFALDPDEVATPELRTEISDVLSRDPKEDGFLMPRRNFYFGTPLRFGGQYPNRQLRLFRRGRGRFPTGAHHDRIAIDGDVGELRSHIDHHPYPTFQVWLRKFDYYTNAVAIELAKEAVPITPATIRRRMVTRPLRRYVERLFLKRGIRDGVPGVLAATFDLVTAVVAFGRYWMARRAGE